MAQNPNTNKSMAFFYPVIIYFLVIAVMNQMILPALPFDAVVSQGLTSLVAGIVIYIFFIWKDLAGDHEQKKRLICLAPVHADTGKGMLIAVLWLGCAGIVMNNLIAVSGLQQLSGSYQQVEQAFYSSDLFKEVIVLGIVTPLAEELLYRYAVFQRLRESFGAATAIAGSALIFAVLHMNLVQAVYAFVLGLLLAVLMERYDDVRVPFIGHATANLIAIFRGETDFLAWMEDGKPLFLPATIVLLVVVILIAGYYIKSCKKDR